MKDLLYVWYHEFVTVFHDKGVMIFVLFVPLCYPLLYSYVYTNEVVRDVPVVAVDDCNSQLSREFLRNVDATPDVRIIQRCDNMINAHELVKQHQAYGIIHIPNNFNRKLQEGEQTYVGLYADMALMLYYKAMLLACTDVSLEMNNNIKMTHVGYGTRHDDDVNKMPILYEHLSIYNPKSGFAAFLIPPILMLIIQQTLLLGIGMRMGSTREAYHGCVIPFDNHFKRVMPVVAGKALFYLMLYFIMAVYMFTFVTKSFGLPMLGDYPTLLAFVVPYILSCTFFAITLSSLIYRREDCILIFVFMSVPMVFLSGISWPSSAMPTFWKYFSYIFPSSLGMNAYPRIMSMGCTLQDIRPLYIGLWAQVLVYFTTSCLVYLHHIKKFIALQKTFEK